MQFNKTRNDDEQPDETQLLSRLNDECEMKLMNCAFFLFLKHLFRVQCFLVHIFNIYFMVHI